MAFSTHFSDEQIIEGFRNSNQHVISFVYREYYGMIERLVINRGGDIDQARDIFQDAMLIIYRKIIDGKLNLSCSFSTYLYAVCKYLWCHAVRKHKESSMDMVLEQSLIDEPGPDPGNSPGDKMTDIFNRHLKMLSEDCRKLLEMHFQKKSLTDIMNVMGYSSEHYTADRKYKCKKSLINRIRSDPEYKRLIDEL